MGGGLRLLPIIPVGYDAGKMCLSWYNGKRKLRYNETKRINERENIVMNGGTLKGVAFWENG